MNGGDDLVVRAIRRRPVLAACLLVLLVAGPFVQDMTAAAAPRLATAGALVDDGTVRIDDYLLGADQAHHEGHVYSDKAPGQLLLMVPAYVQARLVGADRAIVPRADDNLTLWWVTFASEVLPLLAIVVLSARALERRGLPVRASVLAVVGLGTFLLPYASNLYSHVLAAALLFGAWTALDGIGGRWRPWVAGVLLGLAVTVEYQAVLVAVVLAGWLLLARRGGDLVRTVLGALPFGGLLVGYHVLVFGGPLESGYSAKAAEGSNQFTTHLEMPTPAQAVEVLVGSRGLLLLTPVVLLGIIGLIRRQREEGDAAGGLGLVALGLFVLMHASWAESGGGVWAGETPGPRFITVVMPFVVVGLADQWERTSPVLRRALAAFSVANMLLITGVYHLLPDGTTLWEAQLTRLRDGGAVATVFSMGLGPWGWVLHGLLVAAAATWVVLTDRTLPAPAPAEPAPSRSFSLPGWRPTGGT